MQLPTPEGSPSPRTQTKAMPKNQTSTAYCRKMDISMVLNSSMDEQHDEKSSLLPQEKCSLPPMRTHPPTSPYPYDSSWAFQSIFGCLDCFGLTSGPKYSPQGVCNQYCHHPPSFLGYKRLPNFEINNEGYLIHPEPFPNFKLPPIQTFDVGYGKPKHDSGTGAGSTRIQLDDVYLNPKKTPLRASLSPPSSRHSYPSSSHGAVHRHSPRLPQHHPVLDVQGPPDDAMHVVDADYEMPSRSSCNRPYNLAQVDWIRYSKVDLGLSYEAMGDRFALIWPGEFKTGHCFSARLYRDNMVPRVDENNRPVLNAKGVLIMDPAKMREMKTPEGKERGVPYSLVERYPWRAVEYPWVDEERKEMARAILRGEDPKDSTGGKARWREVLWSIENFKYREYI